MSDLAERIARCKKRLTLLIRLDAPAIIIKNEKRYLRHLLRMQRRLKVCPSSSSCSLYG